MLTSKEHAQNVIKHLKNVYSAISDLYYTTLDTDVTLRENYPFPDELSEFLPKIAEWKNAQIQIIEKMYCPKYNFTAHIDNDDRKSLVLHNQSAQIPICTVFEDKTYEYSIIPSLITDEETDLMCMAQNQFDVIFNSISPYA